MAMFGRSTTLEPRPTSGAVAVVDDALRSATGREVFTPVEVIGLFDAIATAVAGEPRGAEARQILDDATGAWPDRVVIPAGAVMDALLDVRAALVR